MARHHSKLVQEEVVRQFLQTKLSMEMFCKNQGISVATMYNWLRVHAPDRPRKRRVELPPSDMARLDELEAQLVELSGRVDDIQIRLRLIR